MTIHFFASFGNFESLPIGGGQTAARRLKKMLEELDYDVKVYNRHRKVFSNKIYNILYKLFWCSVDPILFGFYLLFKKRRDSAVLFMSYAGSLLPFDWLVSFVVRILGFKSVEYLAGGGALKLYESGSAFYKRLFRSTTNHFDEVMVEGYENIALIKRVSKCKTFYLPNFTENGFAPETLPSKPEDSFDIVYFGRITDSKNVLLMIDVFNLLCEHNLNLTLELIGNGEIIYEEQVNKAICESKYKHLIIRRNRVSHSELKLILSKKHVYLFPSNEPREGHSNALNEAMSFGVVPVVSNNNFLPSIVGDDSLVVPEFSPQMYADVIQNLIDHRDLLKTRSEEVYKRVKEKFTQSVVEKQLKEELERL